MIEKLTVGALQSKYWGSSLARGQEKLRRPGAKIATLLLVERRESSQHRVRESGENLVPKEHYTLEIQYRQVDIFVLPIDEHQSFATFAFGTIKNLINDLTTPSKIPTIHPNPYGMGHTTLKYGSMYIGNIHWKHCHLET